MTTKIRSYSQVQDAPEIDIRAFGAECDWNGSTGTDDTVAIQAAIDYGIANKIAVFIPAMSKITASLIIPGDTRGFQMFGSDRRNTGFHNASTAAADALVIGDGTGALLSYDIEIRDLRIEGNGSYTDGKGIGIWNTLQSVFENIMTEFTGSHGFYIKNSYQNTVSHLHLRRAAYGSGSQSVAGFYAYGNTGQTFNDIVAEECSVGAIVDTGSAYFDGLDTENSDQGGLRVVGVSNIQVINGYAEKGGAGDNNWYIGDGTNAIQFAFFRNGGLGNASYIYFKNVVCYDIDQYYLTAAGGNEQIFVTDPTVSRGTIASIYPGAAAAGVADSATFFQHAPSNPLSLTTFNNLLGANGSFESDLTTSWTKGWYGGSGTVTNTSVSALGHDVGIVALQTAVTVATSTYFVRPTAPTTVAGRFYALEFDCTVSAADVFVTCTSGGIRHFNFELPVCTAQHYRFVFKAAGTISILEFQLQGVATLTLDGVIMYEGTRGIN